MVRGLMTDEEWSFFAPFVIATGGKRGRPPEDHRRVLDGVFWIARTGAPWRDLHEHFGKWSSVYRQFRRWTQSGVWELMLEALNASGTVPDSVQMIDSTVVRAHHQAAGANRWMRTDGRRQSGRNMPSTTSFSDSTLYTPASSTTSNPSS
jgi:transposase